MPKAAIYENSYPLISKHDIWVTDNIRWVILK